MTIVRRSRWWGGAMAACLGVGLGIVGIELFHGKSASAQGPAPAGLIGPTVVGQGATGTIKGRLVWGGATVPERATIADNKMKGGFCAKFEILRDDLKIDPKTKGIEYGFAYLVAPKGADPQAVKELLARQPEVVIDQKNCMFVPHSVALHQDQAVLFTSQDEEGHNIHLNGFANQINQMVPAKGKLQTKLAPERRGLVPLKCDIHGWMSGNILVLNHPYFAVTKADGSFEISGVPAGEQNLIVWQERVGFVTVNGTKGAPVVVTPGKTTDVGEVVLDPTKVK